MQHSLQSLRRRREFQIASSFVCVALRDLSPVLAIAVEQVTRITMVVFAHTVKHSLPLRSERHDKIFFAPLYGLNALQPGLKTGFPTRKGGCAVRSQQNDSPFLPPEKDNTARTSPLSQPLLCVGAFSTFGLVVADVLVQDSLHILAPMDRAAQDIASHLPNNDQAKLVTNVLSNAPIVIALAACTAAGVASGVRAPLPTLRRAALIGSLYLFPGWGLTEKDVPLMDLLKHAFRRARPGFGLTHSSTFSMPSGHTFCAFFFISSAILLACTPLAIGEKSRISEFVRQYCLPLYMLGGVTALGRILSDVHWLSDTIAGAALAVGLVSLAAIVLDSPEKRRVAIGRKNYLLRSGDDPER